MKKLFVSFTSLLHLLSAGKVTPEDLAEGLFFFGCWRQHALDPKSPALYAGKFSEQAHSAIVDAVLKAEAEGRAAWHKGPKSTHTDSPWRVLDQLLQANGFPALEQEPGLSWDYGYPAVRDAVTAKAVPLDVVY